MLEKIAHLNLYVGQGQGRCHRPQAELSLKKFGGPVQNTFKVVLLEVGFVEEMKTIYLRK